MYKYAIKKFSWDFFSKFIILIYCLLQIMRWRIFPQYMDIYYHTLTAWGFIQAGGYSGWDFWQYAPVGRAHIYPPVLHIILACLNKMGLSVIILSKLFEAITPILFLFVLWRFLRKNYNEQLAFFAILTFSSSFSFYLALINHIPATIAFIFGFLALEQLFQKKILPSALLLTLCFYTHIGISWFFALAFIFYCLFNKPDRKTSLIVLTTALILSLPILFKQLSNLRLISSIGLYLNERYRCQIKIIDYILATCGLILAFKKKGKYRLFFSLFLASFIFIAYPYRLFSAEGFMPIILLSALFLSTLKRSAIFIGLFIFFFSPVLSLDRPMGASKSTYKINLYDSAFTGMLFAKGPSIWFPEDYLSTAAFIKDNSNEGDIIYCSIDVLGPALASLSGRATSNALLPEIKAQGELDPLSVAKIIIFAQDDDPQIISRIATNYNLTKIGENKLFILYKNPATQAKVKIKRAGVSFPAIALIVLCTIFWLKIFKKP